LLAAAAQTPEAAHPEAHVAFAYGVVDHVPSLQVEVRSTVEHAAVGVADEYDLHVPPFAVSGHPPVAAHERIATEQVAFAAGVVDQVPLVQVEEILTEEHAAGDVTVGAEYESQDPPLAVRGHAPDAAQPAAHDAFARGVESQVPFEQVEVWATDSHVPTGVAEE
jgi:hypothetical protein